MLRQDKRRLIMQAAEKMFASRRFHEITMEEVARAAGVGKGTIYVYFRTKDDLFFETATSGFDEMCALVEHRAPGDNCLRERLLRICREIHEFMLRRLPLFRMMQAEHSRVLCRRGRLRERWYDQRRKLVSAVAGLFQEGMIAGEIRGDMSAETLAHFFLGMLRTRAIDLADPVGAPSHEAIVDLFWKGAGTAAESETRTVETYGGRLS